MSTSIKQPRISGLEVIATQALSPSGTLDLEVNSSYRVVGILAHKTGLGGASDSLYISRVRSGSAAPLSLLSGTYVSTPAGTVIPSFAIDNNYVDLIAGDSIRTIASGTIGSDAGAVVFVTVQKK